MSKIKLILEVADNLRNLADSLQAVAKAVYGDDNQSVAPVSDAVGEVPKISLEQARAVLAKKSRDGFTADIHDLLVKHGAKKLSEINPLEYPALLAEAEALGNG